MAVNCCVELSARLAWAGKRVTETEAPMVSAAVAV